MQKQRCLVVSSPYSWGGGIRTMVDEGLKMLKSLGYKTDLVMPLYAKEKGSNEMKGKRIATALSVNFDKYPLLHHLIFGLKLKNLREEYDAALAIVATSHTALPLVLSGKPFSIWVATSYADELEAKFNSSLGDKTAKRLRNSIQWWFLEKIEKYVLRKATSILALSDYTASRLIKLEPSIKTKLDVFYPPINTRLFSPGKLTQKVEGLLINTGRINDPRKNTRLLVKSFSKIIKIYPQARLLLIGDQPNIHLTRLIKSLQLESFIDIITEKPRRQITDYLKKAEVFVATPTQEGLGISILEAMSCGLPVVVTRCGGPETIIKRSGEGILIDNNEKDFSEAVINLLSNKPLKIKMGINERNYIRRNLSFSSQKERLKLELNKQYEEQ
jgi:glycosyltransferase involved in cell wall biosynthesis